MILALDPSSTRCGYAIMQTPAVLAEAGLLKPRKTTDPALARIEAMGEDLAELLEAAKPDLIVIEVSMGRRGRATRRGGAATLHVYGMAVGFMWAVALRHAPVQHVDTARWTGGRKKALRTADVKQLFPAYRMQAGRDQGGDVADAIGVGRWWLLRSGVKAAMERKGV